jgi:hypothetical protein
MVLLTQVAGMSASEAGRCVGRDHSTVLHAVNKFASAVVAINLSEGASPDVWVRTLAAAMEAR